MPDAPVRTVIAKPGLDGHDRGAQVLARACKDAGMEVIYTGLRASQEEIVATVVQEDADVLGLSILSGAHNAIVPDLVDALADHGADDVAVVVGGVIPETDHEALREAGAAAVFTQDDGLSEVVEAIERLAAGEAPAA